MADLIDRQAAIEAMGCINDSICEGQAIEALWDLPAVQEWIPVTERLPESRGRVIATIRGIPSDYVRIVWFGMYDGEMRFFHSDLEWGDCPYDKDQVSAWIPLPSSYRQIT